jgi:hypothetical protein
MDNGWIKIYRTVQKHWIFSDAEKFRAWILILFTVNYEPKKVNLGNLLLNCDRGESLLSLDSWAKIFGGTWNKSRVRRFFDLLQKDSMIVLKNEHKTTRLTVCNYDTYQDVRNANETKVKRKRNGVDTELTPTKERKEIKNIDIVKNFYSKELEKTDDENYHKFVDFLYGENPVSRPLDRCLKLPKQVNYKSFCNLMAKAKMNKKKLLEVVLDLDNYNKGSYTDLYLTLNKWLDDRNSK